MQTALPIIVGAWSMAVTLWQQFDYYYYECGYNFPCKVCILFQITVLLLPTQLMLCPLILPHRCLWLLLNVCLSSDSFFVFFFLFLYLYLVSSFSLIFLLLFLLLVLLHLLFISVFLISLSLFLSPPSRYWSPKTPNVPHS